MKLTSSLFILVLVLPIALARFNQLSLIEKVPEENQQLDNKVLTTESNAYSDANLIQLKTEKEKRERQYII